MATDDLLYIDYIRAVELHFWLMEDWSETRFGIESRELIESALARPRHAAAYEDADIIRQAATLCFGLIKNHPWTSGNKRTATFLMDEFLFINGFELIGDSSDVIELAIAVDRAPGRSMRSKSGCAGERLD